MRKLQQVLLIDDDEPTNYLNNMVLEEADCAKSVIMLSGTQVALDFLDQCKRPPDLILLDLNMPALDGWDFLEAYQHKLIGQPISTVIVILTTSLLSAEEERARAHPLVAGIYHKPLTISTLNHILQQYFSPAD